jgi:hypothetical protein
LVPGIFFCTHRIDRDDPTLLDLAPTALRLFGLEAPPWMEGRALFADPDRFAAGSAAPAAAAAAAKVEVGS